jgi:ABC-type oligopeptide transport system substrate-binding subunit
MQKPPFKDNPKLRRALYLAINRQLLVAKVLRTGELPAYGWIPPGVTDHPTQFMDPELSIDSQRIKAAKELYSEAGYSQANPFHVVLSYNSGEVHTPLALAIADMWHDTLGVRVTLVADEFKSLLQDIERGKVEVFRSSWTADVNDPSNFLQPFMQNSGVNLTHYANPRFDELIVRAQSAPDVAERRNLLGLAERVLIADAPVIPIYFYVNKHLVKRDVVGWYDNPLNVVYSRDLAFAPQLAVAH